MSKSAIQNQLQYVIANEQYLKPLLNSISVLLIKARFVIFIFRNIKNLLSNFIYNINN